MSATGGVSLHPSTGGSLLGQTAAGVKLFTLGASGKWTFGAIGSFAQLWFRLPNVTSTQRDALTPTVGALVLNTTTNKINIYNGTAWEAVTSA